jgi:hypothetical protein
VLGLDPRTRYVFRRTTLKLGLLVLVATAQWVWGWAFAQTLGTLLLLSALFDAIIALVRRERFKSSVLTYWDEMAFFLICGLGVRHLP